jgi:hypothetical protein
MFQRQLISGLKHKLFSAQSKRVYHQNFPSMYEREKQEIINSIIMRSYFMNCFLTGYVVGDGLFALMRIIEN